MLDAIDKAIINHMQDGFPIVSEPFKEIGAELGLDAETLIERIERLLNDGYLSRFGPLFNIERLGGAFCLCAMAVPADRFEDVAALVNAHDEVAHNYERAHALNMWFVLATETPEEIDRILLDIRQETGLDTYAFPKIEEFFVGFRVAA